MTTPRDILERALIEVENQSIVLGVAQQARVDVIISYAESQKAVLAALMTSLVKKIETPAQDVRQHKVELPGGYSGRVYDTAYITPFIRAHFPRLAMKSGSGWLTRSVEQLHAFTLDFPGRIQNEAVKLAFLEILHDVEVSGAAPYPYLIGLLRALRLYYEQSAFDFTPLALQQAPTIHQTVEALRTHFEFNYGVAGASRLPVLAIYSLYQFFMPRLTSYAGKTLAPLKSHTTSDTKSRSIGDIEVLNADGSFFEAVEIKAGIPITLALVQDAFTKVQALTVARYLLLTTAEPNQIDPAAIIEFTEQVRAAHGCEIIVNGVMPTIKYYLRLLHDLNGFLDAYESAMEADYHANTDLKRVHLEQWEALRGTLGH
jgi:DNA (cytosine-5)-methyltransferase 1